NPLLNKQVRIEGVVAAVDLHPAGKDPDDARVTLYGSTDDPDQRKHVKVVCGLRDKAGAAKVGPGQKVTIQGSFLYAPPFVLLSEATVVEAGPVNLTQVEIERRLQGEPRTLEALEALGAEVKKDGDGKAGMVRLRNDHLTEKGEVKPEVLAELEKLSRIGELKLRNTRISDSGLGFVKKLSKLGGLDLYDTKIGDAGLAHLKDLRSLRV